MSPIPTISYDLTGEEPKVYNHIKQKTSTTVNPTIYSSSTRTPVYEVPHTSTAQPTELPKYSPTSTLKPKQHVRLRPTQDYNRPQYSKYEPPRMRPQSQYKQPISYSSPLSDVKLAKGKKPKLSMPSQPISS